jgi:hypothetical protein
MGESPLRLKNWEEMRLRVFAINSVGYGGVPTKKNLEQGPPLGPRTLGAKIYMTDFNNKGADLGSFWGEKFEFNGSFKNRICCYIFNMSVGLGWF